MADHLVTAGDFQRIYDPSVGEAGPWYINDHCFIRGQDGLWHMFGITREEPARPRDEIHFAHATSTTLAAPQWQKQPFALTADFEQHGEVHLWAPHVVRHDSRYWMFYCAGAGRGSREDLDHEHYRIHLATSDDLWSWQRHPANPMFTDGYHARDPMVIRHDGRWILYYTANDPPSGGHHIVAARTSEDLVHWSDRRIVFIHERQGTVGGPTESPFVVERGGWFYLFIGPRPGGYRGTDVYRSRDPMRFDQSSLVGSVDAHASEVVEDEDGQWYVSHCGWKQGGLYLAPLHWHD